MNNFKFQFLSLRFLLLAALTVLSVNAFAAEEVSKVVASVNGEIITSQDLDEYCQMLNYAANGSDKPAVIDDNFRKDSLGKLIDDRLILGKAKTEKIDIPNSEVDSRIDAMKKSFPSPEAFDKFMQDKSLSMNDVRSKMTDQIIVSETIEKYVKSFISNSPPEIAQYYKDHQAQMVTKPMYTLLVAHGPDVSKLQEMADAIKGNGGDEAIKRFKDILVRIETNPDELKEELAAMSKQCKEAEYLIKTFDSTNYLVYVEKIVPSRPKDLLEATKDIEDLLWKQKYQEKLDQWMKELKEKAVIIVYSLSSKTETVATPLPKAPGVNATVTMPVNATAVSLEAIKLPANATSLVAPESSVNNTAPVNETLAVKNETVISLTKEPVLPAVEPLANQTIVNQTAADQIVVNQTVANPGK